MNNHLRLRSAWDVLAGGVLIMSALPGGSWLGQVTVPYCPNRWVHFLVYAAVASIPCAAWRTKRGVLCCLSVVGFSVVCGLLPRDRLWAGRMAWRMSSQTFSASLPAFFSA